MFSWVKKAAAGLAALAVLTGAASAQVPDPFARELARRLTDRVGTPAAPGYVWLKRHMDEAAAEAVRALKFKGIYQTTEFMRRYPDSGYLPAALYWQGAALLSAILGGWLADRWMRRSGRGRIYVSAIGMMLIVPAMFGVGNAPALNSFGLAIASLILFGVAYFVSQQP